MPPLTCSTNKSHMHTSILTWFGLVAVRAGRWLNLYTCAEMWSLSGNRGGLCGFVCVGAVFWWVLCQW